MTLFAPVLHDPARARKFRQAAFAYLHVAVLYEAAVYAMWRAGTLGPRMMGPIWIWLLLGAVVAASIFLGLSRWQNVIFARAIWVIHSLRLPSLIGSAFLSSAESGIARGFYVMAIVVVVINLWMLARAGWDV